MKSKKIFIIGLLFISFFLTGCDNYKDESYGEQIINCLSKVLIEYVTVDTELPIIKDIFKYKEVRKKTKSR